MNRASYDSMIGAKLEELKQAGNYRFFATLERQCGQFPQAHCHAVGDRDVAGPVTVWCSNDYLGMSQHPQVLLAMHQALDRVGAGSGGTRNIAGTSIYHVELEAELASLHRREAALLFSSCYVANEAAISTLAQAFPGCILLSDELNHASMISGIRQARCERRVWRHNDLDHLEELLRDLPAQAPKIILFESVYSMDGDFAPIGEICDLAQRYGALTFCDEVHAVGLYGPGGAGVAAQQGEAHRIDLVSGTLAKAYGVMGGFITGSAAVIDLVRSFAASFIFTTSLSPVLAAGALGSVRFLRGSEMERARLHRHVGLTKQALRSAGLPLMETPSHIVPVMIGNAKCARAITDGLLNDFGIYVQPINYPTVPKGTERIRLTPGPFHGPALIEKLIDALDALFSAHRIEYRAG